MLAPLHQCSKTIASSLWPLYSWHVEIKLFWMYAKTWWFPYTISTTQSSKIFSTITGVSSSSPFYLTKQLLNFATSASPIFHNLMLRGKTHLYRSVTGSHLLPSRWVFEPPQKKRRTLGRKWSIYINTRKVPSYVGKVCQKYDFRNKIEGTRNMRFFFWTFGKVAEKKSCVLWLVEPM